MASTMKTRLLRLLGIVLVNFCVLIGLCLVAEIILHIISIDYNPLGRKPFRIPDPMYTHTFKPNFDGYDVWGGSRYRFFTNSLGFRDASARSIPLVADRKRIVFIGDSFTEGM